MPGSRASPRGDNPEIVVVGLFEHGVHGQFAAPIVRDVIKAYFDKKARLSRSCSSRSEAMPGDVAASSDGSASALTVARSSGHRSASVHRARDQTAPIEAAYFSRRTLRAASRRPSRPKK